MLSGGDINTASASRLAALASAIRESSLKRLRLVPEGSENWRPIESAMSFADLAFHLKEADLWFFSKLTRRDLKPIRGAAHAFEVASTKQFHDLVQELVILGERRSVLIEAMSPEQLAELIPDERFGGEVSLWWLIARGNLDHEAHHRGQLATYLRLIG